MIELWDNPLFPVEERLEMAKGGIAFRDAQIEKQAARITALESENRELSEFVIAVGGFWGNSKSKLVGEGSLAEVINRGLGEAEVREADNSNLSFALRALVAAGLVTQSKIDEALALAASVKEPK